MAWRCDQEPEDYQVDVHDQADDDPEGDQLPCPSCGNMIFDDTDRCPHCGDWVMPLAAAASSRGGIWVWWTALILAVVLTLTWGLQCF